MASIFGDRLRVSIFGQSHSAAIGVTMDGLPSGFAIDFERLAAFLARRAPGQGKHTTSRKEADLPEFLCGVVDGVTCGAPLTAIIRNTDTRSKDYEQLRDIPRPSHADFAAYAKHGAARDFRGGGEFSGRLTACLCIAGGICLQWLEERGVYVSAKIISIGGVLIETEAQMLEIIEQARLDGDSVGGVVECTVTGMPPGVGEPIFGGVENRLAAAVFGIPAVKGIEFGNGFEAANLRGSRNNDAFFAVGGGDHPVTLRVPPLQGGEFAVRTHTNNHGGVLGGITSGMPVVFRVAFKPTPSIAIEQNSVNLATGENVKLTITGRHDPCIVPRAVPCVEAAAAVVMMDMLV